MNAPGDPKSNRQRPPGGDLVRVLVVTPFPLSDWRWLTQHLPDGEYEFTFRFGNVMHKKSPFMFGYPFSLWQDYRQHDLVVSFDAYVSLGVAAVIWLRGLKIPHMAFSFNHDNKRFFYGPFKWIAKRALPTIDLFVVYSSGERQLFHDLYGIPTKKISFQHWAVNPPKVPEPLPEKFASLQPYLCSIGRSNRDFATFCKAVDGLPVNGVIVCSRGALEGIDLPDNVHVFSGLSTDECLQLIKGSEFSVVPLLDASVGAGHITIVYAMQLGKAQVITEVDTVRDYFTPGEHGVFVPPQDADAMRAAFTQLLENPTLRNGYGAKALAFAEQWLNEPAAARNLVQLLGDWRAGHAYHTAPPGWQETK